MYSWFAQSKNIALQGTHCVGGAGVGLVIQVGDNTVLYVILSLSNDETLQSILTGSHIVDALPSCLLRKVLA